jgi:hypothetical protein
MRTGRGGVRIEELVLRWLSTVVATVSLAAALGPARGEQPAAAAPQVPAAGRGGANLNDACGGRSANPREACPNDVARMIATVGLLPGSRLRAQLDSAVGQGRVFYEPLGHHESIYYNNPDMLAHILAGMQYVLGDLKADDSPSKKKS